MKKILALLAASLFALTGCIYIPWPAGQSWSDTTFVNYPTGYPYDWLWVSLDNSTAQDIIIKNGNNPGAVVEAQVCFPAPGAIGYRPVAAAFSYGPPETITHVAVGGFACTAWIPVGSINGAMRPRPMGGLGAGETFDVKMRVSPGTYGYPQTNITTGIGAAVATGDGYVWYTF